MRIIAGVTAGWQTATLIRLPHGRGLQLNDRPSGAKPDKLPLAVAAFEHLIGSSRGEDLSLGFMFSDSAGWRLARCRDRGSFGFFPLGRLLAHRPF